MSATGHAVEHTGPMTDEPIAAQRAAGAVSARALVKAMSGGLGLNVVNTAAAVVTTIVLARAMELDAFGTYSWVVASVYLLSVPALLGVDRLLVRDVAVYLGRSAHGLARGLLRRSIQLVVATCTAICGAVILAALTLAPAADAAAAVALTIGVLALPALALAWVAQAALMGMHHVVAGQFAELLLRPVLLLAMVLVAVLVADGARIDAPFAAALFTSGAFVSAAVAFALLWRRMRALPPAAPAYESRRWLAAALSLVLLSGALFVNSQIGVVLLGVLDQPESAGLYAVAQRGALLVAFPLLALNAALAPTAARLWARAEVAQLQRLVTLGARGVLAASAPIAVVFILGGEPLLGLVFGAAFAAAAPALAILSLGQLVNAATGSVTTLLMMTGNQWRAGVGIAIGLALNLGLSVVLIPTLHAAGAAIAAATGLLVSNLIHVAMARRALGLDPTGLGLAPRRAVP